MDGYPIMVNYAARLQGDHIVRLFFILESRIFISPFGSDLPRRFGKDVSNDIKKKHKNLAIIERL
jgi:hypothetical protein